MRITKKDTERLMFLELHLRETKDLGSFDLAQEEIKNIINNYVTSMYLHNLIFDKISLLNDKQNYYFLSNAIIDINNIINENKEE